MKKVADKKACKLQGEDWGASDGDLELDDEEPEGGRDWDEMDETGAVGKDLDVTEDPSDQSAASEDVADALSLW